MKHQIDWSKHNAGTAGYRWLARFLGATELVWQDFGSYQGDTAAVLQVGTDYGYLSFGWGSCSGCDALEAAYGDEAEVQKVFDDLCRSIVWFDSLEGVKQHIKSRELANDYNCFSTSDWKEFSDKVDALNV